MKAIFFEQFGEIDVLRYADLPDPEPGPGQALVRVRAVALNHLDIWVRRGWKGLKLRMPHISGCDVAGEIVSGGPAWHSGARVVVNPGITTADDEWVRRGEDSLSPGYRILGEQVPGGLAEFVVVPVENLYRLPDAISFEEGAAPLLVGTTCWRMLFRRAALQPGETVLVVGSGGGVNSLAIILAKAAGADVITLGGSHAKCEGALELGASHAINYVKSKDWARDVLSLTKGRGVDVVIDNVGRETFEKSLVAVRRGGRIVTVGNTSGHTISFDNRILFTKQVSLLGSTMGSRQDFIDMLQFMWTRKLKPVIDRVESLKNGIKMLKYLEDGKQFGKIVLKP